MLKTKVEGNVLYVYGVEDFSYERSCFCGQAFRWINANGLCSCVIENELVSLQRRNNALCIYPCTENQVDFYLNYFDLKRDYRIIEDKMRNDAILCKCIPYASGIHVFNQAPFETLISFIISANNNVKRITGIVDKLCRACGEKMHAFDCYGSIFEYYTFPTADAVARLSMSELHDMGTGYRDSYIKRTAQAVKDGFSLDELRSLPYGTAKKLLCTLYGVGGKVADCVLLFSLGHGEAFPVDVWIKRAVSLMFFDGKEPKAAELRTLIDGFGSDAGRIQQYIFHYARETGLKDELIAHG